MLQHGLTPFNKPREWQEMLFPTMQFLDRSSCYKMSLETMAVSTWVPASSMRLRVKSTEVGPPVLQRHSAIEASVQQPGLF